MGWTTQNEISFLQNIGIFCRHDRGNGLPKAELLRRYVDAARKREHWGDISQDLVLEAAYSLLVNERKVEGLQNYERTVAQQQAA